MLHSTAGTRIYIGSARPLWQTGPAVLADFSGEIWTEITEMENLGNVGGEWQLYNSNGYGEVMEDIVKFVRKAARIQLAMGHSSSDAGQTALVEAFNKISAYPFRIVFSDAPASGTPSERHFFAIVVALNERFDDANRVVGMASDLVMKSSIVRTPAAEGS